MGIGGLKSFNKEDIKRLALKSRSFSCEKCGPIINLLESIPEDKVTESQAESLLMRSQPNPSSNKEDASNLPL